MACWLLKSEPRTFSWAQQLANGVEPWTGVRNHQARNNLRAMRRGDRAFFYHSGTGREIVGMVEVVREAYPDPTAAGEDWCCVDVKPAGSMRRRVTLAAIKAVRELSGLPLLRQTRLSVSPVPADCWTRLCEMGGWTG